MNQQEDPNLYAFELSGSEGIYRAEWKNLHITAKIDRIKANSDHEVKAEIEITSERPASAGHLRHGRINITSPANRKSFAKALEDRDADVDWDSVLEALCVAVLRRSREGAPAAKIEGNVDPVSVYTKWLVNPIIELNNPTLLYGKGSSGKSWLALYIAVLVDAGISTTGFSVEHRPGGVLILDWETSRLEVDARISMIRRGLGVTDPSHIWYKSMAAGLATDLETIKNLVVSKGISLVIIDSIGSACMGEPESAEVVLRMFAAVRSLGVSSLCIDHTNKEDALFGSVYKFNASRQIFEMKKHQGSDEERITAALFHRKANNTRIIHDIGLVLSFGEGDVRFAREDVRNTPLEQDMRIVDRVQNVLMDGPMKILAIAEWLDKSEDQVRHVLSDFKQKFTTILDKNGNKSGYYANVTYRVAPKVEDPIPSKEGDQEWPKYLNP